MISSPPTTLAEIDRAQHAAAAASSASISSPAPAVSANIGTDAVATLQTAFDAPRWAKIQAQAKTQAADLQALCTKLLATSHARHPGNDQAALYSAANRLLLALGSTLQTADVQRYEEAVKAAPAAAPSARGGKASPAPPPAK